jgi:acyl-coenzyme A thioesterase PaaI-like protein
MVMKLGDAERVLTENAAPWVRDLGLAVEEAGSRRTVLRLPWSDRLARDGGGLCGQALMASADIGMAIAVSAARGEYVPMTTVQQSTTFQRPVMGKDVLVAVSITKLGRTLAFADVLMTADGDQDPAAQATIVYALLG